MSKVFSEEHYNADDNAKHQVIEWLVTRGFMAWVNPDQYGIDVQGVLKGECYEFEVEVKHNWSGAMFPFDTIHFSNRKRKFATADKLTWFVMLNDERTHALLVSGATFLDAPVVTKDTIYTQKELFVAIPVSKGRLITLQEGM
tara:strand:+ start:41 stop:469 length:429 start_codon:yes stop_codon:yes gene_type:complete